MKRTLTVLLVLLVAASFVFAQDAEEEVTLPTAEEANAAIETLNALDEELGGVTFSGSLEFGLSGKLDSDTPNLPAFDSTETAKATLGLATEDGKVSASLSLDLLAQPTVETELDLGASDTSAYDSGLFDPNNWEKYIDAWEEWETVLAWVDFWDEIEDDETNDVDIFDDGDNQDIVDALNVSPTTIAEFDDGVVLYDPVKAGETADDEEFVFDATFESNAAAVRAQLETVILSKVDEAIDKITDNADDADIVAITTYAGLDTYVNTTLDVDEVNALSADDKEYLTDAVDLAVAYEAVTLDAFQEEITATTTLTGADYITAASLKLMAVAGVVDITAVIDSANLGVGSISLDEKGHQDDTVDSYSGIDIALTSGLIEGVSAGVSFYSDDNDAEDETDVSDDWYTWLDESADNEEPTEPNLALGFNAGYSTTISDMTIGADAEVGLYDLMADEPNFGFSVMPSFSGMGANVSAEISSGLDIFYAMGMVDYTIMGITPSAYVHSVTLNNDDYDLVYVEDAEYSSGLGQVKGEGGLLVGGGVDVDVTALAPLPVTAFTVGGGASYSLPTDGDSILGWDASLSVTPIEIVTISGGASDAGIFEGDAMSVLAWNADVSLTATENITLSGGVNSKYNDDAEDSVLGWNVKTVITHGAATITGTLESAYDKDDDAAVLSYSLLSKVSF